MTWIIRVSFMVFIGGIITDMDVANGWSELGSDGFGIDSTGISATTLSPSRTVHDGAQIDCLGESFWAV